jgi:hypothetical protein
VSARSRAVTPESGRDPGGSAREARPGPCRELRRIEKLTEVGMSLPLCARSGAGKKAGVPGESASGTPVESRAAGPQGTAGRAAMPDAVGVAAPGSLRTTVSAAAHGPSVPAYGLVHQPRSRHTLRWPGRVAAWKVARPSGQFYPLPAGVVAPCPAEPHLTDDAAEDLVRNALSGPALASAEEHLLLCENCQRRVEALDRFVADLRPATIRLSLWTWLRPEWRTVLCR